MQLRPFQAVGSEFLRTHTRALLCDDAGLGKSAMVLDAADRLGLERILCLGPPVARVSWPAQVRVWSASRRFVPLAEGLHFGWALPGFYFVPYSALSLPYSRDALVKELRTAPKWDALVLDEGQYLKNFGSNRTRAVYGDGDGEDAIFTNAHRVWVLSGTLAPNHAGEVYTHLRALFPDTLLSIPAFQGKIPPQYKFEDRFCDVRETVYGRAVQGSRNVAELRAAIAPVLLRRRKSKVLAELPAIEWLDAPIELDPDVVRETYESALADAGTGLTYEAALALSPDRDDDLLGMLAAAKPNLAARRRTLGIAKVLGCAAWIADRLEAGEPKVVVFAHHTSVLAGLCAALADYEPVVFQGDTNQGDRDAAVTRFQNDPSCRVFLGQIHAAGTAITLTAAKLVFFAEYAGTPGVNYQAASRAHRLGQRDGVQVYFGMVPGSLDEKLAATARRRAREIAELFD